MKLFKLNQQLAGVLSEKPIQYFCAKVPAVVNVMPTKGYLQELPQALDISMTTATTILMLLPYIEVHNKAISVQCE